MGSSKVKQKELDSDAEWGRLPQHWLTKMGAEILAPHPMNACCQSNALDNSKTLQIAINKSIPFFWTERNMAIIHAMSHAMSNIHADSEADADMMAEGEGDSDGDADSDSEAEGDGVAEADSEAEGRTHGRSPTKMSQRKCLII